MALSSFACVPSETVMGIKAAFKRVDARGDGTIHKDHLRDVFQHMGTWTAHELDELSASLGSFTNGSNCFINYTKFVDAVFASEIECTEMPKLTSQSSAVCRDGKSVNLLVTILAATALRDADWVPGSGASDPFCVCEMVRSHAAGTQEGGKSSTKVSIQTETVPNCNSPVWDFNGEFHGFVPGDELAFTVYDEDSVKSNDILGMAKLTSDQFYPGGFQGEVPLQDSEKSTRDAQAYLKLKIQPVTDMSG
eukprot:CAMPEP_0172678202 /NCGR_PEP_ID=MMETSP1074-20121228/15223_1 /TAXON_ID=2916 /ORGANISM="Ceratium fusus, Strain PA161109" /LENGTH=249 /DNA_ID=CAMNT_0013496179 /DNA_START=26 /DNA_END=775 /DNA_ORIENTATION=+